MADPGASPAVAEHDDWDRHWTELAAASERNPAVAYRARLLLRLLGGSTPPPRLLDIGVGSGDFLALAASTWPASELGGVDVSAAGVRMVAARVPSARVAVADLTADDAAPADLAGWATHAVCSEVLEHLDDPVALLRNSVPMLAPGARLVVTVPAGRMSAFDRHIGHRRHYTPELLGAHLREAGLEPERVLRAGFPFFNLYRAVIRARGEALIEDVGASRSEPSLAARAAMAAFDTLFRLNLTSSPWGLQLVALALAPR
jgi:SAM-dependent methyltransferase